MKNNEITVNFKEVGPNEIYIDKAIKRWNHLWYISQYHDEYRLIKYVRKDSPNTALKLTLYTEQAKDLIKQLNLIQTKDTTFVQASSWRRQEDMDYLNNWRNNRFKELR